MTRIRILLLALGNYVIDGHRRISALSISGLFWTKLAQEVVTHYVADNLASLEIAASLERVHT